MNEIAELPTAISTHEDGVQCVQLHGLVSRQRVLGILVAFVLGSTPIADAENRSLINIAIPTASATGRGARSIKRSSEHASSSTMTRRGAPIFISTRFSIAFSTTL
jgi:hypothetical protein